MKYAALGPVAVYLPERVETNAELAAQFPHWDLPLIESKTGIRQRRIAAPGECSSDMGVQACQRLFAEHDVDPQSIDFLLFCTQTPDYALPTTACLMQHRLGLRTNCGALDFNLGCSGFVYGLALADGLIRTGAVRRVLLVTAESYTKLIDAEDRSLRTIFGDAGAASLITAADAPSLTGFQFGTDGSGGDTLLARACGFRPAADALKPRHRQRWKSELYMDGPALIDFTVASVPPLVEAVLAAAGVSRADIHLYLLHQATHKLLSELRAGLRVPPEQLPIRLEEYGNTVSCTLPLLIDELRRDGSLRAGARSILVGFGVGWSWGGCVWEETWSPSL